MTTNPFGRTSLNPLRHALRRFRQREDGAAAVEFALVMSLFLVPAWLGFAEVARTQERVTMLNTTTAMVADMIARFPQVKQDNLDDIMSTATYVIGADAKNNDLTMVVMGVLVPREKSSGSSKPQKEAYVAWSMSNKPGQTTCTLSSPLPPGLKKPTNSDRFLIVVDGELIYDSPLKFVSVAPTVLRQRSIYAPRETATREGPNPCPAP